jgi:uncharacterized protein (DUF433 family)
MNVRDVKKATLNMIQMNYHDRIVSKPGILGGKPIIKGTRVPVELVLQYLANDPDIKNLFAAFPHLTVEDVKACLLYARELVEEEQIFSLPSDASQQEQTRP